MANYKKNAEQIIKFIGGKENIENAAHCVTRLRLSLKDESKVDKEKVEDVELVKGAFSSSGIYQIVIGSGDVEKVYAEFTALTGLEEASVSEVKSSGAKNLNPLQRLVKTLSDIFMPIIPAIIVAGVLMGLNNLLGAKGLFVEGKTLLQVYPDLKGLWNLINMMANTSFVFLPALVGWSATKKFGGSPILGIVMGLMLVHPSLMNAWTYGEAALEGTVPHFNILGLFQIEKVGYQGQVLPVLAAAYILSIVEKWLRDWVPNAIQLLVVPITTILVTGFLSLGLIGPLTRTMGNVLTSGIVNAYQAVPWLGGLLYGALYAPMVATGMHHMFLGVDIQLIAQHGGTFLWPMLALSNIAQGSASLAIAWLSNDPDEESLASTSAISAYFGITEPALFGVTLRKKYPFFAGIIGSALAGLYVTTNGVLASSIGIGGLPGFISIIPKYIPAFLVGMAISLVIPFVLTVIYAKRFAK
ncbi:PTS system, trehalose-specific IIBC component [Halobacteroides halobius DSM 5150]|uniref:PTS system, trehalose-specific IIBC component n=1 Tax=Halobacteroides halobius (strain ATCC 35273 / DSM 5150 / MD-1) TaxID=748449 RepID=L0KCI6_HALHC|nr:PTS system trehalose-specific EIIBC component [Halobacteroides halobius]AGB42094.1 PTS system, trehalose-specific IIBC component [Halobacteroides halobius DSM 5150]